jgi:hypothetical protein
MKKNNLSIFMGLLMLLTTPLVFADCDKRVYVQPPKMEWYMNDCGQWRQAYPGEDPYGDRPDHNQANAN